MPNFNQRPEVPVRSTGRNGFDVRQVVGSVGARSVKLAISEVLRGVVTHSLYKIRQGRLGCRQLRDQVQFRTLRTVGAIALSEQDGQAWLGYHDLRVPFPVGSCSCCWHVFPGLDNQLL